MVLDCAVYADSVFAFAHSIGALQTIFVHLTDVFMDFGLHWKPSSLQILCPPAHPLVDIIIRGTAAEEEHIVETLHEMVVLGCLTSPYPGNGVLHRFVKATGIF